MLLRFAVAAQSSKAPRQSSWQKSAVPPAWRKRRTRSSGKKTLKQASLRRRLRYHIAMPNGRLLIIFGVVLVAQGVLWPLNAKIGLGRLPGDIVIERDSFTLYLPLATSLIIGAVLSILFFLLNR
jgi:hypothetical protein